MNEKTAILFIELLKEQLPFYSFILHEKGPHNYSIVVDSGVKHLELISEFAVNMFSKYPV